MMRPDYKSSRSRYLLWPAFWVTIGPRRSLWRNASSWVSWLSPISEQPWLHLQCGSMIKHEVPHWQVGETVAFSQTVTQQEKRIRKTRESACLWGVWHMGSHGDTVSAWECFLCWPSPPSSGWWGSTLERGSPFSAGLQMAAHGKQAGLGLCPTWHALSADFGSFPDIVCPLRNPQSPTLQSISLNQQVIHAFVHSPSQKFVSYQVLGNRDWIKRWALSLYRPHYLVGKSSLSY